MNEVGVYKNAMVDYANTDFTAIVQQHLKVLQAVPGKILEIPVKHQHIKHIATPLELVFTQ